MSPKISVVVASNRAPQLLEACLASLDGQRGVHEVIVVRAGSLDPIRASIARRPALKVVEAAVDADIPLLRGLGIAAATGDAVAITEDHCVAAPGWVEALAAGLAEGADVVGGGMGNAQTRRAVDWAAYFSEYGFFSSTLPPTPPDQPLLTGANAAYGPRVVRRVAEWAQEGLWEDVIHGRLQREGAVLSFRPEARVLQNRHYSFGAFCVDRYQHGHDYARMRLTEQGAALRWVRLAASPILSAVLLARVGKSSAGEDPGAFVRALPVTFAFLAAWAVGEMAGYTKGPHQTTPATASRP